MYTVTPFKSWHLTWLENEAPAVGGMGPTMSIQERRYLETQNCHTVSYDGEILMCGGTMVMWPGRHLGWAYLGAKTGPHMMTLTRLTRRNLDRLVGRIEFTARCDFPAGQRWAKLLGMHVETPLLKAYGPQGEDHVGFVRFN